jgi:alanyl-tRNA synthetase
MNTTITTTTMMKTNNTYENRTNNEKDDNHITNMTDTTVNLTSEWTNEKVRHTFVQYFVERGHRVVRPSSVVPPPSDGSLLFTNSGMVQFKPFFLGQRTPTQQGSTQEVEQEGKRCVVSSLEDFEGSRVCNSQRCIRVSYITTHRAAM